MNIKSATFLQSNVKLNKLPSTDKLEYAFIGRSNVGKSSLINMLIHKKQLAKTSSTPGKTITINHYLINNEWYLVDLPGYGYAQRSKKDRVAWKKMLEDYILHRKNLIMIFVLVDSRIKPQKIDIEFINQLGKNQIPFTIVLTKCDKLSKNILAQNYENYRKKLVEEWKKIPQMIISSSKEQTGKDEILDIIESINLGKSKTI